MVFKILLNKIKILQYLSNLISSFIFPTMSIMYRLMGPGVRYTKVSPSQPKKQEVGFHHSVAAADLNLMFAKQTCITHSL